MRDQLLEFVEIIPEIKLYHTYVLRDNDGGTAFFIPEPILDEQIEGFLKKYLDDL